MTNCDQPLDLSLKREKTGGNDTPIVGSHFPSDAWLGWLGGSSAQDSMRDCVRQSELLLRREVVTQAESSATWVHAQGHSVPGSLPSLAYGGTRQLSCLPSVASTLQRCEVSRWQDDQVRSGSTERSRLTSVRQPPHFLAPASQLPVCAVPSAPSETIFSQSPDSHCGEQRREGRAGPVARPVTSQWPAPDGRQSSDAPLQSYWNAEVPQTVPWQWDDAKLCLPVSIASSHSALSSRLPPQLSRFGSSQRKDSSKALSWALPQQACPTSRQAGLATRGGDTHGRLSIDHSTGVAGLSSASSGQQVRRRSDSYRSAHDGSGCAILSTRPASSPVSRSDDAARDPPRHQELASLQQHQVSCSGSLPTLLQKRVSPSAHAQFSTATALQKTAESADIPKLTVLREHAISSRLQFSPYESAPATAAYASELRPYLLCANSDTTGPLDSRPVMPHAAAAGFVSRPELLAALYGGAVSARSTLTSGYGRSSVEHRGASSSHGLLSVGTPVKRQRCHRLPATACMRDSSSAIASGKEARVCEPLTSSPLGASSRAVATTTARLCEQLHVGDTVVSNASWTCSPRSQHQLNTAAGEAAGCSAATLHRAQVRGECASVAVPAVAARESLAPARLGCGLPSAPRCYSAVPAAKVAAGEYCEHTWDDLPKHTVGTASLSPAVVDNPTIAEVMTSGCLVSPASLSLASTANGTSTLPPGPLRAPFLTLTQAAAAASAVTGVDSHLASVCSFRSVPVPLATLAATTQTSRLVNKLIPVANVQPFLKKALVESVGGGSGGTVIASTPSVMARNDSCRKDLVTDGSASQKVLADDVLRAANRQRQQQRRQQRRTMKELSHKLMHYAQRKRRQRMEAGGATVAASSDTAVPEKVAGQSHGGSDSAPASQFPDCIDDAETVAATSTADHELLNHGAAAVTTGTVVANGNLFERLCQYKKDYLLHPKKRPYAVAENRKVPVSHQPALSPCSATALSRSATVANAAVTRFSSNGHKRKRRSLLDEIANTEGYVAESVRIPDADTRRKLRQTSRQSAATGSSSGVAIKSRQKLKAKAARVIGLAHGKLAEAATSVALKGQTAENAKRVAKKYKHRDRRPKMSTGARGPSHPVTEGEVVAPVPQADDSSVELSANCSANVSCNAEHRPSLPKKRGRKKKVHAKNGSCNHILAITEQCDKLDHGRVADLLPSALPLVPPDAKIWKGKGRLQGHALAFRSSPRSAHRQPLRGRDSPKSVTVDFEFSSFYMPVYHSQAAGLSEFVLTQDVVCHGHDLVSRELLADGAYGLPRLLSKTEANDKAAHSELSLQSPSMHCTAADWTIRSDVGDTVEVVAYSAAVKKLLGTTTVSLSCRLPAPDESNLLGAEACIITKRWGHRRKPQPTGSHPLSCCSMSGHGVNKDTCVPPPPAIPGSWSEVPSGEGPSCEKQPHRVSDQSAGFTTPACRKTVLSAATQPAPDTPSASPRSQPMVSLQRLSLEQIVSSTGTSPLVTAAVEADGSTDCISALADRPVHLCVPSVMPKNCKDCPNKGTSRSRNRKKLTLSLPLSLPLAYCQRSRLCESITVCGSNNDEAADSLAESGDDERSTSPRKLLGSEDSACGACPPIHCDEDSSGGMLSAAVDDEILLPPSSFMAASDECSMPALTPVYNTDDRVSLAFCHF